jgi:hypothetical protein
MKKAGRIYFVFMIISFAVLTNLSFVSASTLKVTEEHPFLINDVWIPASQLQIGDLLTTIDGKKVVITDIKDVEVPENESFYVYNLEDDFGINNYVVGQEGVVVHNSYGASWSGSQLLKSIKGYKPGTPEYESELIPAWTYIDNINELVPELRLDPVTGNLVKTGNMIKRIDNIRNLGYIGSGRSNFFTKYLDTLMGNGVIKRMWYTTIPPENLNPNLVRTYIHGGPRTWYGKAIVPKDVGVIEFMVPRGEALTAYKQPSVAEWFNYAKVKGWQYESSYITSTKPVTLDSENIFSVKPVELSSLGSNVGKSRMVMIRNNGRSIIRMANTVIVEIAFVGSAYATGNLLGRTYEKYFSEPSNEPTNDAPPIIYADSIGEY